MKASLIPVFFRSGMDEEYIKQLAVLRDLLKDDAEILEPVPVGQVRAGMADAVLFPQLIGDAYKQLDEIKKAGFPFLCLTSEFGTVAMWDWEIVSLLRAEGVEVFTPYNIELTRQICKTLAMKRGLKGSTFLLFQDSPGEGMQAGIFKRFYWWEDRCSSLISEKFGVKLVKKSFKELGAAAKAIPDSEAEAAWRQRKAKYPTDSALTPKNILSTVKMYLALKREVESMDNVQGAGMNCLNESFYSDTTPCLAWNMLFEEKDLLWVCEGDTVSLLTEYLIYKSLKVPLLMSNVYPFLMGWAALKHEKIQEFPVVEEPENHLLVAHCGYFGLMPPCFASHWTLRPKVLGIVDENAVAVDARLPEGPVTLAKLDPTLSRLQVIEAELEGYAQYPGSDCRNGGLIKVRDGHLLMDQLYSHHQIIMTGHRKVELRFLARVLGLRMDDLS